MDYKSFRLQVPSNVRICTVIKKQPLEKIQDALTQGIKIIGVNYFQEGLSLMRSLKGDSWIEKSLEWHFIGRIQSNKIKSLVQHYDLIQSLSTPKHMALMNLTAQKQGKQQHVLIEVNAAKERSKSGVFPEDFFPFIEHAQIYKHLLIKGMMMMGPAVKTPSDMIPYYKETKELFLQATRYNTVNYEGEILSMGMSSDYKVAIEWGATMIRVGSLIFGNRSL